MPKKPIKPKPKSLNVFTKKPFKRPKGLHKPSRRQNVHFVRG